MRRRVADTWHMVNGLVTIPDLLSKLGFWLYRGTMKRTIAVGIALMSVYVAGSAAQRDLITAKQAFNATGAILMISFMGGLLLMALSGSVARSQLTLGEAKGSNLLEDMKKSRAVEHRDRFWQRVFRYEARLAPLAEVELEHKLIDGHRAGLIALCHPNTRLDLGEDRVGHLRAVLRALGRTREGWNLIFDYACQAPMSRTVLKQRLRYDLAKLKDWYDGAPFHHSDTKLQEQFAAAENLQIAKKEAGLDWWFLFWHTRKRLLQAMWFKMITRAVQLRVAQACKALDKKYPTHHFGPDQFLWPSREAYEVIKADAGEEALDDLIEIRQRILRRVLSPDPDLAITLMQKAIYPNFEVASQLRRLYDPE
jgi:hypothetical protein